MEDRPPAFLHALLLALRGRLDACHGGAERALRKIHGEGGSSTHPAVRDLAGALHGAHALRRDHLGSLSPRTREFRACRARTGECATYRRAARSPGARAGTETAAAARGRRTG